MSRDVKPEIVKSEDEWKAELAARPVPRAA